LEGHVLTLIGYPVVDRKVWVHDVVRGQVVLLDGDLVPDAFASRRDQDICLVGPFG
jgi:hypothetical protein